MMLAVGLPLFQRLLHTLHARGANPGLFGGVLLLLGSMIGGLLLTVVGVAVFGGVTLLIAYLVHRITGRRL
jgi:hypothetical protein